MLRQAGVDLEAVPRWADAQNVLRRGQIHPCRRSGQPRDVGKAEFVALRAEDVRGIDIRLRLIALCTGGFLRNHRQKLVVILPSVFRAFQHTLGNDCPGIRMAEDASIFAAALVVAGQVFFLCRVVRRHGRMDLLDAEVGIQIFFHAVHGLSLLLLCAEAAQDGPALCVEPDLRLRLRLRADKAALVRDAAAEPRAVPRKCAAKLLLAGIERFAFLCKFRFALALGQFLHHAQRDGKLHPRPDALALPLAADLIEHIVPVGAEHQREAVRAHVLRGEADGLFDVLPDRAAAAVEIRGLRVEVRNVSLFQRDVIGVHDQPEVVVRVDARDRLPALGGEEIVVAVAVLILLREQLLKLFFCPVKLQGDHGQNVLRGVAHAHAAERAGGVVADIPGEAEVPLHLIGVPDVDHRLRVLVREAALEAGEKVLPAVRQLLHGRGEKVRGFAGSKGLENLVPRQFRAEIDIDRLRFPGAEHQRQLQREAGIAAKECGVFQMFVFESDRRFLAAVAADKFITVAVKPGCGHIACKIHQRRLVGLRLIFHAVAVNEHAVFLVDGQLVLVVALPLQLAHEFHHAKLDVGVNRHVPVTVGAQLQMPEHDVFQRADQIRRLGVQAVTLR